ncbi:MAG: hypothetical protein JNJ93_02510 [Acinetobacter sp.]|nr:hypothetical protein [Acinetobacter sp.]
MLEPKGAKRIHVALAIPFEIHLLNSGSKANFVRHQALVQYWRKGQKTMEINAFGEMNKPMQEAYAAFLKLYLKHGQAFIRNLREQVM